MQTQERHVFHMFQVSRRTDEKQRPSAALSFAPFHFDQHQQRVTAVIFVSPCGPNHEGMTTNEEICQAALRSTLANHAPAANRHALQQKPKPMCRDTEQRGERRIEMRSKKRGKRRRLVGSKKDRGREV